MEILICQSCGSILKDKGKTCQSCGGFISKFSPTSLPVISQSTAPLLVNVTPDPQRLEQVISKRQVSGLLERNNTGGGGVAAPPKPAEITELNFAPASVGTKNDSTNSNNGADTVPSFFASGTTNKATQNQPNSADLFMPQGSMQSASETNGMQSQAASIAEQKNESNAVPPPPTSASQSGSNQNQFSTGSNPPLVSRNDLGAGFQTVSPTVSAPPIGQSGQPPNMHQPDGNSFFASPPMQQASSSSGLGMGAGLVGGGAVAGATVGAAVGVAGNKGMDFFNSPEAQQAKAEAAAAQAEATQTFEPENGKSAPNSVSPSQPKPDKATFDFDAALSGTPAKAPEPASALDFFAVSAKTKPASQNLDKESVEKNRVPETLPSPIEAEEEEDEATPKVARPRGYKPKDGAASKMRRRHDDEEEDEDGDGEEDEDGFKPKSKLKKSNIEQPARRSFSGNSVRRNKKGSGLKKGDDEEEGSKKKKDGFLNQDITVLGLTTSRQNFLTTVCILAFVGLVFFSMVKNLIDMVTPVSGPTMAAKQLPDLSGNWLILFREGNQKDGKATKCPVVVQQNGSSVRGHGQDQYGQFDISGQLTAPANLEMHKIYAGSDPKKPIVFNGAFTLPSDPIYAAGTWSFKRTVGHFLHAATVVDGGTFELNVYPNPAYRINQTPTQPPPAGQDMSPFTWFSHLDTSQKCMFAAFIIVLICGGIVIGSLFIFGPGGKMNISEKQKYIPSQFKSAHAKMLRELAKPLKPGGMPLGTRCEWRPWCPWETKELAISPEVRASDPHILIMGASDKGKSRLMAQMITHDIEANDRAVVVIDSDGGLAELLAKWIASHAKSKEYAKRVIYLDPTFKGNGLGYNPLEMPEDEDLQSAASSVVYGFKAIYTEPPGAQSQWNQQTANILRNAAMLLMVNGKTLTDLPALLNDNDFRDVLLESVEKRKKEKAEFTTLLDTWGQYKRLARTDQWINWVEPILNRVGPMLSDARIRSILTKPASDIKLKKLIEEKKILIVKVAKGQLDQNANLLGSLIVTGVKQAALSLANEQSSKQNPVALYLDEFDNFIEKETIETITSETDKFKIGFIGCIKTLQHLPEDFRHQVIIAVGTLACFALAKKDGDLLGPQMFRVDGRKIKHQTIQTFFNKVNTTPQFEMVSDEEKLNIDRVVGQDARTFFCYRVGTVAGVFHMKSHDFNDIPETAVNKKIIEKMHSIPE